MKKDYFCHESAFVDEGAIIGNNAKIWHNTHVTATAHIGDNCNIGQNCFVAGKMGKGCKVQNNVNLYLGVEIADWVFCGPSMTFTNDLNPRAKYPKNGQYIKTIVEEGVSFGAHSIVICGVKIGKWALIGAGTVVTKDVPAYAVFYGNPGRIKGWITERGDMIPFDFKEHLCKISGMKYKRVDEFVVEKISS
jgi:UDP-2-acetamido-3-amino-2,3-dideoxy-glucuronate N-acetyltransferase